MNISKLQEIATNSNVFFVPFKWMHPLSMDLRQFERETFELIPDFRARLRMYEQTGNAVTVLCEGKMVCSFGVYEIWSGVAEAWLITSKHFESYPISATRTARRFFDFIAIELQLHRLQIGVNTRDAVAVKWAKMLNFDIEGVNRAFGPDKTDWLMMSRIY